MRGYARSVHIPHTIQVWGIVAFVLVRSFHNLLLNKRNQLHTFCFVHYTSYWSFGDTTLYFMKKFSLVTLCLIAFICSASAQQAQKKAAPHRYGWDEIFCWGMPYTDNSLYTEIQCVKIKTQFNNNYTNFNSYYEFNEKGNVVYMETSSENDRGKMKPDGFQHFEYNDSGKIVKAWSKSKFFFENGWNRDVGTFEYNDNNELIYECVNYNYGNGYKYRYLYDNNGNKILHSEFDIKDNLTELTIYTYDANNNLISRCMFDGNHNLVSRYDYVYEYDDRGNIIKEYTQASTDTYLEHKVTYDKKGNQIITPSCKVESKTIIAYTIYSYDENNILTEEKEYVNNILKKHLSYYTDGYKTKREVNLYNETGVLYYTEKYNNRGDVVEEWELTSIIPYNKNRKYEYEYDSHNNIIKVIQYDYKDNEESPIVSYVEYEITYR